jgi:hypothetical protein
MILRAIVKLSSLRTLCHELQFTVLPLDACSICERCCNPRRPGCNTSQHTAPALSRILIASHARTASGVMSVFIDACARQEVHDARHAPVTNRLNLPTPPTPVVPINSR